MSTDPAIEKHKEKIPVKLADQKLQTANNKINHAFMQFKGRN